MASFLSKFLSPVSAKTLSHRFVWAVFACALPVQLLFAGCPCDKNTCRSGCGCAHTAPDQAD